MASQASLCHRSDNPMLCFIGQQGFEHTDGRVEDNDLLLMPNHTMWHIWLFQIGDLFRRQFYSQCANGIVQV